jgi:hypothetical protein
MNPSVTNSMDRTRDERLNADEDLNADKDVDAIDRN